MSIDLPADVERELERYAASTHVSPAEAAGKLIMSGLRKVSRKTSGDSEFDWDAYKKLIPGMDLFDHLSEGTLDDLAKSSRRLRSQKLTPRD